MLATTPTGEPAAPRSDAPRGSAFRVYGRLLGYALQYKFRLAISLFFAVTVAVSFTAMLFTVREVVNLTYYDAGANVSEDPQGTVAEEESGASEDPQEAIVAAIRKLNRNIDGAIELLPGTFWERHLSSPQGLEPWFRGLVASMRADKVNSIKVTCIALIVVFLGVGIAKFLQEFLAGSVSANISTELARHMYENLMMQSVGFFETRTTGDVLARFTNDIFMVNRGLEGVLVKFMREPILAVFFLGFALLTDPVLTLIGICGMPLVVLILAKIGMKMRKSVRRSLEKVSSMASVVHETVNGISIVKVFTMEQYEIDRVRAETLRLRRHLFQMVRLHAATGPSTEFILVLGVAAFLMGAALRIDSGDLTPGQALALLISLAMLLDPVRKLSAVNNMVQTSIASAERVFEFIDLKPQINELEGAADLAPMAEGIHFENVTFGYLPDTPVIKYLNLHVRKGETVALVGPSGSGKSTLIKLIPRFYDVETGTIRIDGTNIRDVSARSLRDQISLVTQNTVLFAETVRENIAAGRTDYTEAQIERAARAANAHEFIVKLPKGYDTRLDESGATLSGGQRQRLAIARAFIKDPSILILDEATSSLDSESERLIQHALDNFLEGRTAFIIAHRLSTIQRADRILVIDGGRIIEDGNHATLLAKNGAYSRLYNTQFDVAENETAGGREEEA